MRSVNIIPLHYGANRFIRG